MTNTNTFWIGANIIFELATGTTREVVMLVHRESEATPFEEKDAQTYFSFVRVRAPHIQWFLDAPTPQRPHGYLIRGVQTTPGR